MNGNNKLKMAHSVHFDDYDILLGFENIIFIFYFTADDGDSYDYIYCVDILFNIYALKNENNFVYIMDFMKVIIV